MDETFELWDTVSGNLVAYWATEADALADLRAAIPDRGIGALEGLVLSRGVGDGPTTVVGRGAELARISGEPAGRG